MMRFLIILFGALLTIALLFPVIYDMYEQGFDAREDIEKMLVVLTCNTAMWILLSVLLKIC